MVASMSINSTIENSPALNGQKLAMDRMYRLQRHIYDVTRAYYLLGRDDMINNLAPPKNAKVLEIGCGTGRNIIKSALRFPDATFYGFDISDEMLKSATAAVIRSNLAKRVKLVQADALNFDSKKIFGQEKFDRVYFSYTLSMIPDWENAIAHAMKFLSPKGELHIVDFGQCDQLPSFCRTILHSWLRQFHVTPRQSLQTFVTQQATLHSRKTTFAMSHKGYAWHIRVI
jgi:S-adenosylmethionine-diacylgycerolhomoserine-N-methlytransferase